MSGSRDGALPTFFVIGAPKAGTTSLHHYLELHPQIQMSAVKEPSFFATAGGPGDRRKVKTLEAYEALFDPATPVRGDASPNYAMYPLRQGVPERISQLIPEARLIYVVRDPVDRTVSHYHQMVATEGETRPLHQLLSNLEDPRSPCVCASMYALQLELYLRRFDPDRILILDQAHLLNRRRDALRRVFAFLGVDERFESDAFDAEFNKGEGRRAYPPALSRFVSQTLRPRTQWIAPSLRRRARKGLERAFLPKVEPTKPDESLRARLGDFYTDEVARLRALTGQSFEGWSV